MSIKNISNFDPSYFDNHAPFVSVPIFLIPVSGHLYQEEVDPYLSMNKTKFNIPSSKEVK